MTSQLNVDTIVDKAGSGGTNVKIGNTSTYVSDGGAVTQNTVQGLAKAWTFFDGSAGSLSAGDSFNESSLTDHATGDYTFTITNAMGNTNYTSLSNPMCEDNHGRGPICLGLRVAGDNTASTNTTTARRFECLFGSTALSDGAAQDTKNATVVFIGELA